MNVALRVAGVAGRAPGPATAAKHLAVELRHQIGAVADQVVIHGADPGDERLDLGHRVMMTAQDPKRSLLQVAQRWNVAAHRHAYLDLAHFLNQKNC